VQGLRYVLGQRQDDLVSVLVQRGGFDVDTARRFVAVAGEDLVESYEWQAGEFVRDDPSARGNVRLLLGSAHANAIASTVGISRPQAWHGLRTLVPRVMSMVSDARGHLRSA
jgi:hypothetical protein